MTPLYIFDNTHLPTHPTKQIFLIKMVDKYLKNLVTSKYVHFFYSEASVLLGSIKFLKIPKNANKIWKIVELYWSTPNFQSLHK
jgi:hypothetical protein